MMEGSMNLSSFQLNARILIVVMEYLQKTKWIWIVTIMKMALHSAATPTSTKTKILRLERIVAHVVEAPYREV